jgi:hypothetical protein
MKRLFPYLFVVCLGLCAFGCQGKTEEAPPLTSDNPNGITVGEDRGVGAGDVGAAGSRGEGIQTRGGG